MSRSTIRQKGVILYMILVSILITVVIAGIILNIITNQARFSHHEVSRIQAYYAAMAGVNYAIERLRSGCWTSSSAFTRYICRSNTDPQLCSTSCDPCATTCSPIDDSLPASISLVVISVSAASGSPPTRTIAATANYTYTP